MIIVQKLLSNTLTKLGDSVQVETLLRIITSINYCNNQQVDPITLFTFGLKCFLLSKKKKKREKTKNQNKKNYCHFVRKAA